MLWEIEIIVRVAFMKWRIRATNLYAWINDFPSPKLISIRLLNSVPGLGWILDWKGRSCGIFILTNAQVSTELTYGMEFVFYEMNDKCLCY